MFGPLKLAFSIIRFEKKEKEEKETRRISFRRASDARESRVVSFLARKIHSSIDSIYHLRPGENYPRRGRKEKAWENSGELDK